MSNKITSTRRNESYCINDPRNRQTCILGDPNLCKWDYFSACLEANPEIARKKKPDPTPAPEPENTHPATRRKPFYEDEPLDDPTITTHPESHHQTPSATTGTATPASPPPPAPPRSEADRLGVIVNPYDANDGLFESENVFTIPKIDTLEIATVCLRDLVRNENKNSKSLAHALLQVKRKFFSEKGKKKGWRVYVEKEINFTYRQAQNLMKGYLNPIILEYWDDLGIGKISLLNRYKQPVTSELIDKIIHTSHREAQKILFPSFTTSKQKTSKLDTLINNLKNIDPAELAPQTKKKLKLVLQETLKQLIRKE